MALNPLLVEGLADADAGAVKSRRLGEICVGANTYWSKTRKNGFWCQTRETQVHPADGRGLDLDQFGPTLVCTLKVVAVPPGMTREHLQVKTGLTLI